jgi:hypothetical protein
MRWAGHVARIGRRGMHVGFWWENQKERDHEEGLDIGGRIILQEVLDLREIGWCGMVWIGLVKDKEQRQALVNRVVNLRVPYSVGKFLSSRATGGFPKRTQVLGVS